MRRRTGDTVRRGEDETEMLKRGRMRLSERIKSYRDLRVFQNAMDAAMEIFTVSPVHHFRYFACGDLISE